MRWRVLALILLSGCDSRYTLVLLLPDDAARQAAVSAELHLLGGCPDDVAGTDPPPELVFRTFSWRIAGDAPDIGELEPGGYGLYGRVRDADCSIRWAGCTEVRLQRDGDDRIEVPLASVPGPGCRPWESCGDGAICDCGGSGLCQGNYGSLCCEGGCTDLGSDPHNCGECGLECSGTECLISTCAQAVCQGESVPVPNGTPCGDGGTCSDGQCSILCDPGDTEEHDCGACGTQVRTCDDGGQWSTFGECMDEGTCFPGEFDSEDCDDCGSRSRSCDDTCNWEPFGDCSGEGICAPGEEEEQDCGQCGTRHAVCDDTCEWEDVGLCDNTPGRPAECADGEICTTDTCLATGQCAHAECVDPMICCELEDGCQECCGTDATSCTGAPGVCHDFACADGACETVEEADGADPEDECPDPEICCSGACAQCCDPADCGAEALCADWQCQTGTCTQTFETAGTDPENECPGADCCDGDGTCTTAC